MGTNKEEELVAVIQALLVKQRGAMDLMAAVADLMDEAARELAEAKKESRKGERRAKP